MTLQIDADLAVTDDTKRADNFTGSSIAAGTTKFIINNITAISDNNQNYVKAFEASTSLKERFALSQTILNVTSASGVSGTYRAQYLANEGYLLFVRDDIRNIVTVTRNEYGFDGVERTYTMSGDENIATEIANYGETTAYTDTTQIGAMGPSNVTINASTHNVLGGNKGGITIGSGNTYNINGGTWSGFTKTAEGAQGAVLNNSGTLNVDGTTFSNNSVAAQGGAIYNTGTANIKAISGNTSFSGNTANGANNDVYNQSILNLDAAANKTITFGGTITGNSSTHAGTININSTATTSAGGVVFNNTITDNKVFQTNGMATIQNAGSATIDPETGAITVTSANTYGGTGARFYTLNGGTLNIDNSVVANNTAGAISINDSTVNISGSKFVNNLASDYGSVIYNRGNLSITSSVFSGNRTSGSYEVSGGAIMNFSGTITTAGTATDKLQFTNNVATSTSKANGGAIRNENGNIGTMYADFTSNNVNATSSSRAYGGAIDNSTGTITAIIGDFYSNKATATSNNVFGGAIWNYGAAAQQGVIGSITGDFVGNYASTLAQASGGAIDNNERGRINGSITGNFIDNYVKSTGTSSLARGGAIYNIGYINSIIGTGTTKGFSGNYAQSAGTGVIGGAIGNVYYDSDSLGIDSIVANFTNNYAYATKSGSYARGGAVYNGGGTIGNIAGNFSGNYAIGTLGQGGAIYNSGTITLTNSSFTNNAASATGGAIYNTGTTTVKASTTDVAFSGNKTGVTPTISGGKITGVTGGVYNDIYNTGTLNLKAASGKSITFGGTINGASGVINLNNDATVKGGTYTFNNTVSGNTVNLYNGASVVLGTQVQGDSNTSYGLLTVAGLTNDVNGGNINSLNSHIESNTLGAVTLGSNMTLQIDADLANLTADNFSGTSIAEGSTTFIINSIVARSDNESSFFKVFEANEALKARFALSQTILDVTSDTSAGVTGQYKAKYLSENGYLIFMREDIINLVTVTRDEYGFGGEDRTYELEDDENIADEIDNYGETSYTPDAIGTMGDGKVTVNAGEYTINGTNANGTRGGVVIGDGNEYDINGGVWTGFGRTAKLSQGAVLDVNAGGTLDVAGSTFENNSIAYTDDTETTANSYVYVGGVIHNAGEIDNLGTTAAKATFSDNTVTVNRNPAETPTNWREYHGGAIANVGTISSIVADFTDNSISVTGTMAEAHGGAISNAEGAEIGSITGDFSGNYAVTGGRAYGGAINNNSYAQITNGVIGNFTNNYAKSTGTSALARGGAVYNLGYIKSLAGTGEVNGFSGNYAESSGTGAIGGALANMYGTAGSLGIDSIIANFTNNYAYATGADGYAQGGAIYNQGNVEIDNVTGNFSGNYAIATGADGYAQGGAVYNETGTITLTDSSFSNNAATTAGGAIYNTGTTTVKASTTDVAFRGNKTGVTPTISGGKITGVTGGTYNDIYNTGTINLKAATDKSITFDGTVIGSADSIINLNNDTAVKNGNYIFNNSITGGTLSLYNNAQVKLGRVLQPDELTVNYGTLSLDGLTNDANGGKLDLRNSHIDANTLGSVTLSSDVMLRIEADLANTDEDLRADRFSATSIADGDTMFIIERIVALSDNSLSYFRAYEADETLKERFALITPVLQVHNADGVTGSYYAQYLPEEGYIVFTHGGVRNLLLVTRNEYSFEEEVREYDVISNENIAEELDNYGESLAYDTTEIGAMGPRVVTINADEYTISGGGRGGLIVGSGNTYNINDGTWSGFARTASNSQGAVINNLSTFNANGTTFSNNSSAGIGGAINNSGTASLKNVTLSDNSAGLAGGAVYNSGTISEMSGAFTSNVATSESGNAYGGAVYNSGTISEVKGGFTSNVATSENGSAYGGAIYNEGGTILGISGNIQSNHAEGPEAHGGAIYNKDGVVELLADAAHYMIGSNYVVTSDGDKAYEGIYSEGGEIIVKSQRYGRWRIYDYINGTNGYDLTFRGDDTGVIELHNTIQGGADLTVSNVELQWDLVNNGFDHNYMTDMRLYYPVYASIDIRLGDRQADTFTSTGYSTGLMILDEVQILDYQTELDKNFRIQVLYVEEGSTVGLGLSDKARYTFNSREYIIDRKNPVIVDDEVQETTPWDMGYYQRHTTSSETVYGKLSLSDDRQAIVVRQSRTSGGTTTHKSLGDTLRLVNQDRTHEEKTFAAQQDGDSYALTDSLGETYGTLNVRGKAGGKTETIYLNKHKGFVLGSESVLLNLSNVKIADIYAKDTVAITVDSSLAQVHMNNVIMDSKITGYKRFSLTTTGDTVLNSSVRNANITNEGTLTTKGEHIVYSDIDNAGTLKLSGTLDRIIGGVGTTKVDERLGLKLWSGIEGTLDLNYGTVDISENQITVHEVGRLTGYGTLNIDLDLTNQISDRIVASGQSDGEILLESVNFIEETKELTRDFNARVLDMAAGSTAKLVLSDGVRSQFNNKEYIIERKDAVISEDKVQQESSWTPDLYQKHTTYSEVVLGKLSLSDDKQGIVVKESGSYGGLTIDESLGDTLKLVNQNTRRIEKNFTARYDGDTYVVGDHLGNTKMTVNIKGISGGEVELLDLNGKSGFILGEGAASLNLQDIRVLDRLSPNKIGIHVTNNRARVGLTDVILDTKIKGDNLFTLMTSGETRFNETVENARLTNSGTLTAQLGHLMNSEITNRGTFVTHGTLNQLIDGSGTVSLDGSLKLGSDAGVIGTLAMNNQDVTVSFGEVTTHTIGVMTGYGLFNIDINLGDELTDTIYTSVTSDGQITLKSVNIIDAMTTEISKDMNLQVLNGGVTMTLSDEVRNMFDSTEYIIDQGEGYTEYGKLSLGEDGKSIVVTTTRTETTRMASAASGGRRMLMMSNRSLGVSNNETEEANVEEDLINEEDLTASATPSLRKMSLRSASAPASSEEEETDVTEETEEVTDETAPVMMRTLGVQSATPDSEEEEETDEEVEETDEEVDDTAVTLASTESADTAEEDTEAEDSEEETEGEKDVSAQYAVSASDLGMSMLLVGSQEQQSGEEISKSAGGTKTQYRAAKAWVDSGSFAEGSDASEVSALLASLAQRDAKAFNEALSTVAPTDAPVVQENVTNMTDQLYQAVDNRLAGKEDGLSSGDALTGTTVWAKTYRGNAKLDDRGGYMGYESNDRGMMAGIDRRLNRSVKFGMGIQYDADDIKGAHRKTEAETLGGFMYGQYKPSDWYINGAITYSKSDYEEEKVALGRYMKNRYSSHNYGAHMLTGYDFGYFRPEGGLRYNHIKRHGYTDSFGQDVSGNDLDILRASVGVHGEYNYNNFIKPEAYLGVTYDLISDKDHATVSLPNNATYTVEGKRLNRFAVEAGAGITAQITDKMSVGINYLGTFREDYHNHTGYINVQYAF